MTSDLLVEIWDNLKPLIAKKDRMDAADVLVKFFDEHGMLDGIQFETGLDKFLTAAIQEYVVEPHDDEGDMYEDW